MADVVVFLGPTLSSRAAREVLDAVVLPPAEQGSIVRAVAAFAPNVIVLVDGAFGHVPAVRHQEILWAMSQGIAVAGAGSMGAIRAAELSAFGMRGFGLVYRWYARTPLADDDEVAVAMAPAELGSAALGEALINMRLTFARARRDAILTRAQRDAFTDLARSVPFVERSYDRILAEAQSVGPLRGVVPALRDWLPAGRVDQKRSDALGLLALIARTSPQRAPRAERPPFRMTEAWAHDLDEAGLLDLVRSESRNARS